MDALSPIAVRFLRTFALTSLFLAATAGPSMAQVLSGLVVDPQSTEPIEGAVVTLMDSLGVTRQWVLSDAAGSFILTAPFSGSYRVAADRIGYRSLQPLQVVIGRADTLTVTLHVSVDPVRLDALRVEGRRRCDLSPEEGIRLAAIWQEAREALAAAAWTAESGLTEFRGQHFRQELDRFAGRVVQEQSWSARGYWRHAFQSVPVSQLNSTGFVHRDEDTDTVRYFAPDSRVLLSEEFLSTHCFGLALGEGDAEGSVGIVFVPKSRGGRGYVDIRGIAWIDAQSAELQWLEFSYTGLDARGPGPTPGGRVSFDRTEQGTWYVDDWWILSPIIELRPPDDALSVGMRPQIVGFVRRGAAVQVEVLAEEWVPEFGWLEGVTYDSTGIQPLRGVRVRISGTEAEATSDFWGRFRVAGLLGGIYEAVFSHAYLDSLGYSSAPVLTDVRIGGGGTLEWTAPSRSAVIAERCQEQSDAPGRGTIVGRLVDERTGMPLPGGTVRVEWTDVGEQLRSVTTRGIQSRSLEDGSLLICGVPMEKPITVWAEISDRRGERKTLSIGRTSVATVELTVPFSDRVSEVRSTQSGVLGLVIDGETARPLAGATVRVSADERVRLTDRAGRFVLPSVPPGPFSVSVEYLGYHTRSDTVWVARGDLLELTVPLAPDAIAVEGLVVEVRRLPSTARLGALLERVERGLGEIMLPADIERAGNPPVISLLQRIQGVRLRTLGREQQWRVPIIRSARNFDGSPCAPVLFIDGHRLDLMDAGGAAVADLNMLSGSDILALEVYRGASEIPAEFSTSRSRCGVIAIWTR